MLLLIKTKKGKCWTLKGSGRVPYDSNDVTFRRSQNYGETCKAQWLLGVRKDGGVSWWSTGDF